MASNRWDCAYQLTRKYANKRATDPFHLRRFTSAVDIQKFDACVQQGLEFINQALAAKPDYVDAMYYQGLLYREKQKATVDPAERRNLGTKAAQVDHAAVELEKRQRESEKRQQD